jgi:hypothetical protein
MSTSPGRAYISYKWGGDSERVAGEIEAALQAQGITLVRDKSALGYRGGIREFMQELGQAHAVVVVVSDLYLRAENCMFELVEIARNPDIHHRIFPVILPDADIYRATNRLKYVAHWEEERRNLEEKMRKVSLVNLQGITDDLNRFDTFRDQIAGLTDLLKNMNALTPEMHARSGFAELAKTLKARLATAAVPAATTPAAAPAAPAAPARAPAAVQPVNAGAAAAYLASIGERLTKAGYEALRGERFGELRFKTAYNRFDKGFIVHDHHRVLAFEEADLTPARLQALQGELMGYVNGFVDRENENLFLIAVVVTGSVSAEVKRQLFDTPLPDHKLIEEGRMLLVAVYSSAEDDLLYPKAIPSGLDAEFEDKLQNLLLP